VWACGAWLPALFAELVDVRITQQDVFWFGVEASGVPAWCDYDGAAYGAGSVDGAGLKVCPDLEGRPLAGMDGPPPAPDMVAEARARRLLAERFPAFAGAPLAHRRTCQYELTPDTRAILAPHPEHGGSVWLLGGTSGHGFKHAPAWAELVLGWLEGRAVPDPAFGLGDRGEGPSLRTAGTSPG
jgi:glycine/D-amino acid oxidase-like deaminating enzyme